MKKPVIYIVRGAIIAALYVALTLPFSVISFEQVQFRFSEALTLLPILFPEAILGLFVGCLVSNIIASPFGVWDVALGSLATLAAAYCTYRLRKYPLLAAVPPVVINAVAVGFILYIGAGMPFVPSMLWVGLGQTAVIYVLGIPLLVMLRKALKL